MTTNTRRRSGAVALTGIAADERRRALRASSRRAAAVASIAGATLVLAGCTAPDEGVVMDGADGQQYVVPEGALRPEYDSKEDCIADVTEQIQKLQAQGETISDSPEDLCESSDRYHGGYAHGWVGPMLFPGTRWNSPRVSSWTEVSNGNFAATGSYQQTDVYSKAPAGSTTGQRAPLKGGFGSTGKGGFGEHVGG